MLDELARSGGIGDRELAELRRQRRELHERHPPDRILIGMARRKRCFSRCSSPLYGRRVIKLAHVLGRNAQR